MTKSSILAKIAKAVLEYDTEAAAKWAQAAVDEGIDPEIGT